MPLFGSNFRKIHTLYKKSNHLPLLSFDEFTERPFVDPNLLRLVLDSERVIGIDMNFGVYLFYVRNAVP